MKNYNEKEMRNLKLLVTLSRCNSSVNSRIYPKIKEEGLTETQFSVLNLLYHKGKFNIKEIIEKTFSSGGTMTVVVNNLLKEGYIKKIIGVLLTLAITVIAVIFFSGFAMAAQVTEVIEGHGRIHINGGVDDGFVVGATVCFSVHSSEGSTCGTVVSAEASRAIVKVPSKAARRMRKGTEAILIVEIKEKKEI